MGFDGIFQQLIHVCINTTSFSVLVEGWSTDVFQETRGLHHGDTLSPLIFTTIIKILSWLLEGQLERYKIKGIEVALHLAYANDLILNSRGI